MHIEEIYKLARCSSVKADTIEGFLLLGLLLSAPDAISEAALVALGAEKRREGVYFLTLDAAGRCAVIELAPRGVEVAIDYMSYHPRTMGQLRCLLLGVDA